MYKTGNSPDKTGYRMKAAGCFETSAAARSNIYRVHLKMYKHFNERKLYVV